MTPRYYIHLEAAAMAYRSACYLTLSWLQHEAVGAAHPALARLQGAGRGLQRGDLEEEADTFDERPAVALHAVPAARGLSCCVTEDSTQIYKD